MATGWSDEGWDRIVASAAPRFLLPLDFCVEAGCVRIEELRILVMEGGWHHVAVLEWAGPGRDLDSDVHSESVDGWL